MFAQALQVAPVYALTGNIILCYNLLFMSTFVISAIGAYLLVRDLTGDWRAGRHCRPRLRISAVSDLAGSPHLQVMSSQWMPLALWGLHRFIARRSVARAGRRHRRSRAAEPVVRLLPAVFRAVRAAVRRAPAVDGAGRLARSRAPGPELAVASVATFALTCRSCCRISRCRSSMRSSGRWARCSPSPPTSGRTGPPRKPIHLWGRLLRLHPHGEGETFLGVTAPSWPCVAIAGRSRIPPRGGRGAPAAFRLRRRMAVILIASSPVHRRSRCSAPCSSVASS